MLLWIAWCSPLTGQDLNLLRERAEAFWSERQGQNVFEAAQYVEPDARDRFVRNNTLRITQARVLGFTFGEEPGTVEITVRVQALVPGLGEVQRTNREDWVWRDGEWFRTLPEGESLFNTTTGSPGTAPPEEPLALRLLTRDVDLGRVVQGERLEGLLAFEYSGELSLIRPLIDDPGMTFGEPALNDGTGTVPVIWDTLLVSDDIDTDVTVEILTRTGESASDVVSIRAEIEPRLGIGQTPAEADPSVEGTIEVRFENFSSETITPTIDAPNPLFTTDADFETLEPGEAGIFRVHYPAMSEVSGASLFVDLGTPIIGRRQFGFPLRFKVERVSAPTRYTREQLDQLLRQQGIAPRP
jgi:hypothetical protein